MSRTRPTRIVALLAALLIVAAACGETDDLAVITSGNNPVTAPRDIVDTAINEELDTLVAAVEAAELEDTLRGEGPLTVFAPTEAAFDALPEGLVDVLLDEANADLLAAILTHHVVDGRQLSTDLIDSGTVSTLGGGTITVDVVEVEAEEEGGEPTSEVHVNDGEAVVTTLDQLATNGVVHLIDAVLVPADRADELAALIAEIPEVTDIVSTAERTGGFDQLLGALEITGLATTLRGEGTFTVFAPTDGAFATLSPEQQAALEDPELLEAVLSFHVLGTEIRTDDVLTERFVTTLEGQGARFSTLGDTVTFAGVTLVTTDIEATNGVIHVINEVLVPDSATGPGGL